MRFSDESSFISGIDLPVDGVSPGISVARLSSEPMNKAIFPASSARNYYGLFMVTVALTSTS
jgi:hypothetical protein